MGSSVIKVIGAEEFTAALATKGLLKSAKKIVRNNTVEMTAEAKRLAPYETGFLMNSIQMNSEDSGMRGLTTATAEYSAYLEYGTRYQASQPFMAPAYNKQKEQFKKDMDRLMK